MENSSEISPKLFWNAFWKGRWHCLGIVFLSTLLAIATSFLIAKKYVAVATIMSMGDAGQGSMESTPVFRLVGLTPNSYSESFFKFKAVINSRTFQEQVVESLGPGFFTPPKGWSGTPEGLKNHALGVLSSGIKVRIDPDQSNVLNVMVETEDPGKAPVIANQVLVNLQNYISKNSLTNAKRLRNYIENNIIETKAAIFETSVLMAGFYNKFEVKPQKSMVENPLLQDIMALSSKNFDEISRDPLLKGNLGLLEEKKVKLMERLKNIKEIPEQSYFDYLQGEYNILKELNITLRQQYELAKLEAVRQEPSFQILDRAAGASYNGPARRQFVFGGVIFGGVLSAIYVFYRLLYRRLRSHREIGFFDAVAEEAGK